MKYSISRTVAFIGIMVISGLALESCGNMKYAPQAINADGEILIACRDTVWIENEGDGLLGGTPVFRIKFTGRDGLSTVIKGIHKLRVEELPKDTPLCR